jgi:hypothetical protein
MGSRKPREDGKDRGVTSGRFQPPFVILRLDRRTPRRSRKLGGAEAAE